MTEINIGTAQKNGELSDVNKKNGWKKSESPLPAHTGQRQMNFFKAIELVNDGEKITRIEWGDEKVYGIKKDGFLMLHKDDDKFHQWIINDGDLEAVDWIII